MNDKNKLCATTPLEDEKIKITAPKQTAAGPIAVLSSIKHVYKELSLKNCSKTLFSVNQMTGFDCPGCAWPDPDDHRSAMGEFCENGVKAIAEEATEKRVGPGFFAKHNVVELSHWSDFKLGKSGRLTHPMILYPGKSNYEKISWEEAFQKISTQLNNLSSPDEAIFYTSGRTSNEAAFLYQLFVRQYGTNNLPDCSNMCHESSGVALSETLGIGKGSVKLEDFYITDLIIVVGQNPGTNHPRMLSALQKAKKNNAQIITINPLPEAGLLNFKNPQNLGGWLGSGTNLTDLFLQVKVGADVPLFKAILCLLLEEEEAQPGSVFDRDFIEKHTHGYQELIESLRTQNAEELAKQSGVDFSLIKQATHKIKQAKRMIICWAMGLTQHKNAVQNIQELVNLLLLKGCMGKPGSGTCPVRGHSNVQGDRTMGIWEKPKDAFLNQLKENFDFEPPRTHGYDTVNAIKAMAEGKAKVFFAMGGNFLSATPDTNYTARALQNCELTVQVSTKLNRSHLITGKTAIILPCLGRTEIDLQNGKAQFVSVENSMGIVHASRGQLKPASEHLKSEPAIVSELAEATLKNSKVKWTWLIEDYDRIRDIIEQTIPGFGNYNQRVRNDGGFYLPNGAREGNFHTNTGKANFTINPIPEIEVKEDEFIMMTIRSHDQFNTTIYGLDDRYRGIFNARRIVLMHKNDIQKINCQAGDEVDIIGHYEGEERIAPRFKIVAYPIPEQCIATYFPETNVLVPINSYADRSYTPTSKNVVVKLKASS